MSTENIIYADGKDNFDDFTFSAEKWSAPIIKTPDDIRNKLNSFSLCGRKIKYMKMVGYCYSQNADHIEATAYSQLQNLPEEERQRQSEYKLIDPEIKFPRYAQIDEPLLIEFEDGDVFEILVPWETQFQMSMNRIPMWIDPGINMRNVEADVLFSNCIGQTITAAEVHTFNYVNLGGANDKEKELVSDITLRLANGDSLVFSGLADFCEAESKDADGEISLISFGELQKGLFNWEDLQTDEITGFFPNCSTIFFGSKGKKYIEAPFITIYAESCEKSQAYIDLEDFLIMDWCISLYIGNWFDEYGEYEFTYDEWHRLLDEANALLSIDDFDALFDKLIERQGDGEYMLVKLNTKGAEFWEQKKAYRMQVNDLREWTELVLNKDSVMHVFGF